MVKSHSKVFPVKEQGIEINVEIPSDTILYDMKIGRYPFGIYLNVGSSGVILSESEVNLLIKQLKTAVKEAAKTYEEI